MRSPPLMAGMHARLRSWALRRQGQDTLPLKLAARRIYILPTPAGWMFGFLLGVMFIAGMNYGNGLALLFTFWLAGFALVAMVQTQRNLAGTRLLEAKALPGHAGGSVRLILAFAGRGAPQDLALRLDEDGSPIRAVHGEPNPGDDAQRGQGRLLLDVPVARRGRWFVPPLHLSSSAPFGLFRTWTWIQVKASTIVYPRAVGTRPVPESSGDNAGNLRHLHGLDELAWLRDFREGDSPRQVAWKAYARGQPLLVREYLGEGALRREFDFDALQAMDTEARLSQLTWWILETEARGESWVLRLPGTAPLAGSGPEHLALCLTRLALFGNAERAG